jgi:acetyl esterase/lipase
MSSGDDLGSVRDLRLPPPDAVVRYAPHDDGLVDVHLPVQTGTGPAPLVVLFHGGFWKQAYDRRHTRPVARTLASEGYVVATPEYRRVGGAGGWPRTTEDVDRAAGAVPALLQGIGVATRGLTLLGHSAGGHLALWLASRGHPVDRVVGLAPVGDLRAAARERLGDGATQAFLGGEPADHPARYDSADPAVLLRDRPGCALVVVHGSADDVVPVSNSQELVAAVPGVDLRVVDGADHFDVMNPTSTAWPAVLAALR